MENNFFYTGGAVPPEKWTSYIEREADHLLYRSLSIGDFCYVLTSRQMGKTSLSRYTRHKLEKDGIRCVYIDINLPGRNATEEQWYFSITDRINQQTAFNLNLEEWWEKNNIYSPLERFTKFIDLLVKVENKVVVFIDEIDIVLNIDNFETDDFFAAIRSLYMERANDSRYNNISFALIGVAAPNDLMKDTTRTPFNVGKAIPLYNLELEKAYPVLSKGLPGDDNLKRQLVNEVFKWTHGQPYLTQFICKKLAENGPVEISAIQASVQTIIKDALNDESTIGGHLEYIQRRILGTQEYPLLMLSCYQKIYNNEEIKNIANDPTQIYLRLSGIVMQDKDRLVISNGIYQWHFNERWINDGFYAINKYYTFLKQWLDSGRKELPAGMNEKILGEYKEWANRNTATREDYQFITYCSEAFYQKEKRQRRFLEVLGLVGIIVLISVFGLSALHEIRNRDVRLAESYVKLEMQNNVLRNYHYEKQKQDTFAIRYLDKINQLDFAISDSKPIDTINVINSEINLLEDSLKKVYETTNVTYQLLLFNKSSTERIRSCAINNNKIDSLQKQINFLTNRQGTPNSLSSISSANQRRQGKVVIITVCDKLMDNSYFSSGNFYNNLVKNTQKALGQDRNVITAGMVNDYIQKQGIDLCAQRYRSLEIAKYFNTEFSIVVDFSGQIIRLKVYDILQNKVIEEKNFTNDVSDSQKTINNLVSFIRQSF